MSTSASAITTLIASTAEQYGVDPQLALEVAIEESSLNPNASGSSGEIGLFQLMPATAAALGVDPTNMAANIQGGCMLLAQLLSVFQGDIPSVLAAYNAGHGYVQNLQSVYGSNWLSYASSGVQRYVATITANLATQYNVTAAMPGPIPAATPIPAPGVTPAASAPIDESGVAPAPATGSPYSAIAWGVAILIFAVLAIGD